MPLDLPDRFIDRYDAARQLLPQLLQLAAPGAPLGRAAAREGVRKTRGQRVEKRDDVVVLAVPRGGLEVGAFLARELARPLDVVLVKKVAAQGAEELAIGAVALDGAVVHDEHAVQELAVDEAYLETERQRIVQLLGERERAYHARVPALEVADKKILLVDDGIATGLTLRAAVGWLRRKGATSIIVAAPVAAKKTIEELRSVVDSVVVARSESPFYAVGTYYERFPQIDDRHAVQLLEESRAGRAPGKVDTA